MKFFIASPYPKSGTTLLLETINQHSINKEEKNFEDMMTAHIWNSFTDFENSTSKKFVEFHCARCDFESKFKEFVSSIPQNRNFPGQKYAYIKDPSLIQKYFPESKFLFIARDPRDAFASYKCMKQNRGETPISAKEWNESFGKNLENFQVEGLRLTYESFVTDYDYAKIFEYLDLPFEEIDTKYANEVLNKLSENKSNKVFSSEITKSRIGRWKEELTDEEVEDLQESLRLYDSYCKR